MFVTNVRPLFKVVIAEINSHASSVLKFQVHHCHTKKMQAQLCNPAAVFVSNGEMFIADMNNHRVRKVLRNGQIVTIAGTGVAGYSGDGQLATSAQLEHPVCVVVSSSNQVYISESHRIRKIDQNGIISTIAGTVQGYNGDDQLAVNAKLNYPRGLFVTEDEEVLFADMTNNRVRKIDRNGMITTIAGTGTYGNMEIVETGEYQLATSTQLSRPSSVYQYKNEIYIADMGNNMIRKILKDGTITNVNIKSNMHIPPYFIVVLSDELLVSYYGVTWLEKYIFTLEPSKHLLEMAMLVEEVVMDHWRFMQC